MKKITAINKSEDKIWYSTTGYRILLILKSLIEKSRTIDELVSIVEKNSLVNKSLSKDTIRMDINTLKTAGCEITRPSKANEYKYELEKHPFILNLSEEEIEKLINIRNSISLELTIDEVFILNSLYKKIIELSFNEEQIEIIENTSPLINLDKKIYNELMSSKLKNRKIEVKYNSPNMGEEEFYVIPINVVYENGIAYLKCFNYKYNAISMLDISRIFKISKIEMEKTYKPETSYNVIYEVKKDITTIFEIQINEKVISETDEKFVIEAKVENEFLFIQRVMQLGTNFKIISPEFFKEKLINKIKQIQRVYQK